MDNALMAIDFLFSRVFPLILNTLYSHWLLSLVLVMVLFAFFINIFVILRGVK